MNILLIGCCKNIEDNIEIVKQSFKQLSEKVASCCKGVFYENNSSDKTAELLKNWEKSETNIKVISEFYTDDELLNMCYARTFDNKPCRMEIISMARNKLLEEIEKSDYDNFDYVIMFDMDHKSILPVDKIISVLNKNYDFDALICKGTDRNNDMYDTYAYRDFKYPLGAELIGDDCCCFDILKKLEVRNKTGLLSVLSGFNGMCIYKKASMKNIRYSAYPSKALDDIYRNIIFNPESFKDKKQETLNNNYNFRLNKSLTEIYKKIDKNLISITTHNEGRLQGVYLFGTDGIFYTNCSGYNFPIVCEHVIFFVEMRSKGFDKIYLCPELEWSSIWTT